MLNLPGRDSNNILRAIGRSLAVIEFDPSGTILKANENFCRTLGYAPSEIVGRHHRIFTEPAYAASPAYRSFWSKLANGEYIADQFKRIDKTGRPVWIQASYNPVTDARGRVYKVVKFAADISAQKRTSMDDAGKLTALQRSQAIIEFTPDGDILCANDNFLAAMGYTAEEVVGRHHRIFCDPDDAASPEYAEFWSGLRQGRHQSADFKRFGKNGRVVWIQASYNPILDEDGKVYKVVKFATDLTDRMVAVESLGVALSRLSTGDLAQRIDRPFMSSLDPLRVNFNHSVEGLQSALRSVQENADAIHSGADRLRTGTGDLARRTEQQAAAIEETSAALAEITGAVKLSSKRAAEAGTLVSKTRDDAERSAGVVGEAVEAMGLIQASSNQIGNIIGVIDEIAFQTNLLALNAGVEAARAGEAGRGFAVVAQEVRGLAQRSAEAAKAIKALISTSTQQVEAGVDLVGRTGQALDAIAAQVAGVSTLVVEIVQATHSQAEGLQEVNDAVGTFDTGTQQNAAMVEQSTAATSELAGEASALNALLSTFELGAPGHPSRAQPGRSGSPVHELTRKVQRGLSSKAFASAG